MCVCVIHSGTSIDGHSEKTTRFKATNFNTDFLTHTRTCVLSVLDNQRSVEYTLQDLTRTQLF